MFLLLLSLLATPTLTTDLAQQFSVSKQEVDSLLASLETPEKQESWLRAVTSPKRSLLVIDMQEDFITGSLAVPGASELLGPLTSLVTDPLWDLVVFSQDWHPPNHISFLSNVGLRPLSPSWLANNPGNVTMFEEVEFQGTPPYNQVLWPDHCVQGSQGAELDPSLPQPPGSLVLKKGTNPEVDSYSAFYDNTGSSEAGDTGLAGILAGSTEVVVVGLATDYCVGSTSLHSLGLGLPTVLLADLARPVSEEGGQEMKGQVREAGGLVTSWDIYRESLVDRDWTRAREVAKFLDSHGGTTETSAGISLGLAVVGLLLVVTWHFEPLLTAV